MIMTNRLRALLNHTAAGVLILTCASVIHAAEININGIVGNRVLVAVDGGNSIGTYQPTPTNA